MGSTPARPTQIKQNIMNLITKGQFTIKGRGEAYIVSLKENKLPTHRKQLPKLLGQQHSINGKQYVIWGYEIQGMAQHMDETSLLVRPV